MKYKSINIIGSWFSGDGYSAHTKQLAIALEKQGIEVSVSCNKPADWIRGLSDIEFKILSRQPENAEVNLFIGLPHYWPIVMSDNKPFIGFFVWEGDVIPEHWLTILQDERCKQIWVPSNHCKEAILNTLVNTQKLYSICSENDSLPICDGYSNLFNRIHLVPHGVDTSIFYPLEKDPKSKLTFIMNGGWPKSWNDRKGLSFGTKAYLEEFTNKDDVEMIVKVNTSYGLDINKNISDLNITNKETPALSFLANAIPYEKLNELYSKGDIFLNTSLADGFNLACLEAMACGLPVVTTTFGGMTDFVNEGNGYLLKEGELKEVFFDSLYEGVKWKKPSIEEIRKKLREIYNDRLTIKEKAMHAYVDATEYYTWDKSAKKAILALEKL
jgi:glycosyltransferase involved in cell wall biosynthesis